MLDVQMMILDDHGLPSIFNTVQPVLNGHSKIDKTKDLKADGSLLQNAPLQYF